MKVLVTGGSGLAGRHVVAALADEHEVVNLDIVAPARKDMPFIKANVLDSGLVCNQARGFDAVVHLAGIPTPLNDPAEKVFQVNVMGTFNMLDAAAQNGIQKFIFMSSESTLGFAFSTRRMWPDYLPVDENHRLRPQDPYGLSKLAGELLCAGFSRQSDMSTVCLRAPWIWVPESKEIEKYRSLVAEYENWHKSLWAFIHVADVAQAIARALTVKVPEKHETFFVCADNNWTEVDSKALVKRFYPEVKRIARTLTKRSSLISNKKAKRLLGFAPRFDRNDILFADSKSGGK